MDSIIAAWDRIEQFFGSIGLMSGALSPVFRGSFAFATVSVLMAAFRPSFSYDAQGNPRPWAYLGEGSNQTVIPWWLPGLFAAILVGLFV